jgi:putative ribosome biogenesis GTPase RsgA
VCPPAFPAYSDRFVWFVSGSVRLCTYRRHHGANTSRVIHAFPDLEPGTEGCPRACSHDEPDCALDDWVAEGHADPARLYSLRRLLAARERTDGD